MTGKEIFEMISKIIPNFSGASLLNDYKGDCFQEYTKKEIAKMLFENCSDQKEGSSLLSLENVNGREIYRSHPDLQVEPEIWCNIAEILELEFCEICETYKPHCEFTELQDEGLHTSEDFTCDDCRKD